jgi:hypothetical protein
MKRGLMMFCLCSLVLPWAGIVWGQDATAKTRLKSVTVYPPAILPAEMAPASITQRIAEVLGMFLERAGMDNIELADTSFSPPKTDDPAKLAEEFGQFVAKQPLKTEYALYIQITAPEHKIKEILTFVVDKTGKVVSSDKVNDDTYEKEKIKPPDEPLTACLFIVKRLDKVWDLADPMRENAPEGKMAEIMKSRSALPPDKEIADMKKRLEGVKDKIATSKVTIYPIHLWEGADKTGAVQLAKIISQSGICQAEPSDVDTKIKIKGDPNEQKILWDTARAFRDFLRKNPPNTEYALLADYGLSPASDGKHEAGHVHLILCNKSGDWVLVDFQNSHHADFQSIAPKSVEDCNRLAVIRLKNRLSEHNPSDADNK